MPSEQNFKNHSRLDPLYHFFVLPVFLITVIAAAVHAMHTHAAWDHWVIVVAAAGLALALKVRTYALKVQDRVIRLEERIRLSSLAGERLRPRIGELTESQLIALRFASDAEVPALAEKALLEKLSAKQIKQSIRSWRPDYWRV
jgi:hypothetical protein